MHQSFTGTSRRPRQVNLSGRQTTNPFSKSTGTGPAGAQQVIASAQQDRLNRHLQRERLHASTRIQNVWRGHHSRRKTFKIWRRIWDQTEEKAIGAYLSEGDSLRQLRRLVLFFSPASEHDDVQRLAWYGTKQVTTSQNIPCTTASWSAGYSKLSQACLLALTTRDTFKQDADTDRTLLGILAFAAKQISFTAAAAVRYYEILTSAKDLPSEPLEGALLAPLQTSHEAYTGLVVLLARPLDPEMLSLLRLAVNPRSLSQAVLERGEKSNSARERLWLVGNLISLSSGVSSMTHIAAVGRLLGSLADELDFEARPLDMENFSFDRDILSKLLSGFPLNSFLSDQIISLLDQRAIRNLLSGDLNENNHAQVLAGYALTLLRCFPRRADEIRMWLHLGPPNIDAASPTGYLWTSTKQREVFLDITASSRAVLDILKAMRPPQRKRDDWTIILVFLELFTFDLKIMDDEEFIGSSPQAKRNSAVPVGDVAQLVTFLKNLGFTLYFEAAELNSVATSTSSRDDFSFGSGRRFGSRPLDSPDIGTKPLTVAGLPGLTIDYLKGLVTGLLRAIYERDSRRKFLPRDHWLMTDRFDMKAFIPGVVAEEESRHMVQEQEDEDKDGESEDEDLPMSTSASTIVGTSATSHFRSLRTIEARARASRKASRKRYLESVAPRLEILQNMPFFIPFHTRVEIFRQFVHLDQIKRRNGAVDPDLWRQSMTFQPRPGDALERHHAKIKRSQEFLDAYDQFYDLGAGLKEPIQITFVDKWDMPEAGIDGGGVTKEFLTSVIGQAFDPEALRALHLQNFFVENDQHLLHPNPTAVEDMRIRLHEMGLQENSPDLREQMRELLKQYEFLGRVIGKCLYEGILIDVSFAGFFLKKWALNGGTGSAPNESHYRPNINDLRELDEGLYRGLLNLKNASNAEDFGLTFTVNDEVGAESRRRVVEIELAPHGADTPVTNENRLSYINRMASYRLQAQSRRQTNAFLRGLGDIVQPSWLSMFNQTELQTLIGGAAGASIDLDDLRRNTLYGGTYQLGSDGREHASIRLFWSVMAQLPDADRRAVLRFVTSTPRGPLLGFAHLVPRFSIRDSGPDQNRYPTTSTCVNLLKLPMYTDERVLREKLLAAVNSGAGFDLS